MKFLLVAVNAKFIHSNLAVRDLKAYAEASGRMRDAEIEIAEFTINQMEDEILADIYKRHPDRILISCYIWNMAVVRRLSANLKKIIPQAQIWLGGPEVTYGAAEILEAMPELTGIMVGEGEETFTRLLQADDLCDVTGIVYRSQDKTIMENPLTPPVSMDQIPFFYQDMESFAETYAHRIIYYESSRGCPFRCSYCLSSIDKSVRFRSLQLVLPELQFFLDAGVQQVKFVDRTFNCRHEHAMGIWNYLKAHDNGITNFHFEIAADLLTEEEIELLGTLRPGQVQLEIGVQSTNPDTLRAIDRVQHMEHLRDVVDRIHAGKNIHQHLDLIVGLPYEDFSSFRKSFDEVYSMQPQQLQLGFLKVLRGSVMHRDAEKYGICYHGEAPYEVLYTNDVSYEDIIRLKGIEEMVEVYYNSLQFPNTIRVLVEKIGSAFDTFADLAEYYKTQELAGRKHSRLDRFHILRDFIKENISGEVTYFEELLLYDLYLRENSKSRPKWASDESVHKAEFQEYFRREAGSRYDRRMLHGEVFTRNVGDFSGEGPWKIIFDYRMRDALTGNASVHELNADM